MKVPFADLHAQYESISCEIDSAIRRVIDASAFIGGAALSDFERSFADFCGAAHCVGVGNGTDALYIALRCLGIGPGDEVITAANSFIATSEAITLTGARVVFADCDTATYTISPADVEAKINGRTKAIVPVHLYGCPAEMDALWKLADMHGLKLIEDAAQAHGASYRGRNAGTLGDVGCFSFYPGKNLGAYGDAGCMVTKDPDLAKRMRMMANHGRISKYDHEFEGINSRLDGLQAAILGVKLKHLDDWTEKRRQAAAAYIRRLSTSGLILPIAPEHVRPVYHLFVVQVPERDRVQAFLSSEGIQTGIHYPIPLPFLKAYSHLGHKPEDFPVAYGCADKIISLPMYPEITDEAIDYVCRKLLQAVGGGSNG